MPQNKHNPPSTKDERPKTNHHNPPATKDEQPKTNKHKLLVTNTLG